MYCWESDSKCNIIDGKITLYSPSIARGDNASVNERLYAEGVFLEGKFQGVWKYYDKNGKVIRKEKWDNGRLITENSNKHYFAKSETLNVMDYPLNPASPPLDFGIYLYKYQWDIMLSDIKTPTQRGDLIKTNATDGKEIP